MASNYKSQGSQCQHHITSNTLQINKPQQNFLLIYKNVEVLFTLRTANGA